MIVQNYELNMIPRRVKPLVNVSQFDDGGRTITFNMKIGDNTYTPVAPVILIEETEVPCTFDGADVSFVVTEDLTQSAGLFKGELRDTNNGIIGSCNFTFRVDSTPRQ